MSELSLRNSNSLVPAISNPFADDLLDQLAAGTSYLPRLTLFSAGSTAVKDEKIPQNHWGLQLVGGEVEPLGREVDVLVITRRPKAIDTSDRNNIRASYDIKSDLFLSIKETAETTKNSGCQFGMEFLMWVPKSGKFATYLMGSPTARIESRNVANFIGKPMTLKSRAISNGTYKWQGPVATACSTPLDPVPTHSEIIRVSTDFLNPKEQPGLEVAPEPAGRVR